jgi:periplasmic protein CpxP/Spy
MQTRIARLAVLGLGLGMFAALPLGTALAQDNGSSESNAPAAHGAHAPDPQKQAQRLTHQLGLSSDQTAKLTTILQGQQQQIAALRADSSLSQSDRREKMRGIREDSDKQINALLTPSQQQQYQQLRQNGAGHWQGHHGPAGASSS